MIKRRYPRTYKFLLYSSPFFIYLLISILFFGPHDLSAIHSSLFNNSSDPQSFVWFLNWWPYSILHGLNPFISKYVWYPSGFNLTWSTSIPTAALMMTPITLLWGALVSFNVLAILAPVLSALTCFYLVYYLTKNYLPSLFSGYIFGFSSYELGQLLGHTNLYLTFLLPLIILVFLLYLNYHIGKVTFILLTSLMLAAEFGISNEVYTTFILFGFLAILIFYLTGSKRFRHRLLNTTKYLIFSLLISLIILAPYLYFIFKTYTGVITSLPVMYSADILNFIVPTPITRFGGVMYSSLSSKFIGNFSEEGSYIGLPFVILLMYISIKYWKKIYIKELSVLFLIVALFTLGPVFHFGGTSEHFYLPWNLTTYIPLVKYALPDRFSMYLFLLLAVLIGIWLEMQCTPNKKLFKYAVVLVAISFILPNASLNSWQKVSVPSVYNKKNIGSYVKKGSSVLMLPYNLVEKNLYFQYDSGMHFKMAGGNIDSKPSTLAGMILTVSFLSGTPDPNFKSDLYQFCKEHDVAEIIYTPSITPYLKTELSSIKWSTKVVNDAAIISVP